MILIIFLLSFKNIIKNGIVKINIYIPLFLKNIIIRIQIVNKTKFPLLFFLFVTISYSDINKGQMQFQTLHLATMLHYSVQIME